MPTKTKPKADETYIALYSFVGNTFGVAQGRRLRGDHDLVQRFPERFVPEDTPDDEVERLRKAATAPAPLPERLTGRFKLRVLPGQGPQNRASGEPQTVTQGGRVHYPGETLIAEDSAAEHLVGIGVCEIVRRLPAKKRAKAVASPGLTTATGRSVA